MKSDGDKLARLLFQIFVRHLAHTVKLGIGIADTAADILYKLLCKRLTDDLCYAIKYFGIEVAKLGVGAAAAPLFLDRVLATSVIRAQCNYNSVNRRTDHTRIAHLVSLISS